MHERFLPAPVLTRVLGLMITQRSNAVERRMLSARFECASQDVDD
jgi:hypothetical protein